MDYLKFFELEDEPFRNDGDPRFFFQTRAQARARVRLMRGIQQRKGLMLVSGGPGCGKTTLARHLLETLDGPKCVVRMLSIPHAACDSGWVLPRLAETFGVSQVAGDPLQVLGQIFERLAVISGAGQLPVLLVDEAQLLRNPQVMEEFRGLLNMEHEDRRLLSMVLFGLPDLVEVLRLDPPLAQRVDVGVRLDALEPDEVGEYMRHRLGLVGGGAELFGEEAIDALSRLSEGIPRLINTLADNALFEASLAEAATVDGSTVIAAAEQLGLLEPVTEPKASAEPAFPVPSGLVASFGARAPSSKGNGEPPPLAELEDTGPADWVAPLAPEPQESFASETEAPPTQSEPASVDAPDVAEDGADSDPLFEEEEQEDVALQAEPEQEAAETTGPDTSEIDNLLDNLIEVDGESEPPTQLNAGDVEAETIDSLFDEIQLED